MGGNSSDGSKVNYNAWPYIDGTAPTYKDEAAWNKAKPTFGKKFSGDQDAVLARWNAAKPGAVAPGGVTPTGPSQVPPIQQWQTQQPYVGHPWASNRDYFMPANAPGVFEQLAAGFGPQYPMSMMGPQAINPPAYPIGRPLTARTPNQSEKETKRK
jgi:hypothetical protein